MARCEECLHYDLCETFEVHNDMKKVPPIYCGFYKPTADVVPKSEVELLEREVRLLTENRITAKYPHCVLGSYYAVLTKSLEDYEKVIADISIVAKDEVERLNKEFDDLAEEHSDLIVEKDRLFDIAEKQQAEIERLERICHSYALQYGTVTDQQKVIDKAKAEVAREIFEEIESKLLVAPNIEDFDGYVRMLLDDFCELKKKYTEGENDR